MPSRESRQAARRASPKAPRRVPRKVLAAVFARSFLLQAGFNPRSMQGPGLSFALQPALRSLYPGVEERTAATRRHLVTFNTHPALATAVIGGLVRIEEEIAAGITDRDRARTFLSALSSPLAALGDAFFWTAWRPACALIAVVAAPILGLWSILLFLLLYNAVHLILRTWLFVVGYRHTEEAIALIAKARLPTTTRLIRRACTALVGAATLLLLLSLGQSETLPSLSSLFAPDLSSLPLPTIAIGFAAGLVMVLTVPLQNRVSPYVLTYVALALGILGGLVFAAG